MNIKVDGKRLAFALIHLIILKKTDNPSYNEVYYVYLHIIIKIKTMTKNTMANKLPRKSSAIISSIYYPP